MSAAVTKVVRDHRKKQPEPASPTLAPLDVTEDQATRAQEALASVYDQTETKPNWCCGVQ